MKSRRRKADISPLLLLILAVLFTWFIQWLYEDKELISPYVPNTSNFHLRAYEGTVIFIKEVKQTNLTIEDKIRRAFPEDPEIAVAVGMSESHLVPEKTLIAFKGHYSWSTPTYEGECSIGLFMINLASDGCRGYKVHYSKIPGNTLDQKIEWLKIPDNNIKIARDIYDGRGGNFSAWAGYTGGGYLKHLKE